MTLKSWMADMKTNEQVTFTHKPGAGIQVDVGGAAKGAKPPNAGLKAGLLGAPCA